MTAVVLRSNGVLIWYFVGCVSIWICLMCFSQFTAVVPGLGGIRNPVCEGPSSVRQVQGQSTPTPPAHPPWVLSQCGSCVSVSLPLSFPLGPAEELQALPGSFLSLNLLAAGLGFMFCSVSCKLAANSEAPSDLSLVLRQDLEWCCVFPEVSAVLSTHT